MDRILLMIMIFLQLSLPQTYTQPIHLSAFCFITYLALLCLQAEFSRGFTGTTSPKPWSIFDDVIL